MSEDHHDEKQFKSAESGAAATFPKQCSALREDGYVMIRGRACKIENLNVSTARMHEDVPIVHLVGIDIFTSKKLEDICPSTHNMDVPVVKRREYILMSIEEDGFCSLMDPESCDLKDDLKMPDGEMGNSIREAFDKDDGSVSVQVVAACGEEAVVNFDLRPIELKKELVERRRVLKSHPTILAALCNNETKPTSAEQGHPIASTPTNAVLKVIHSFLNVFLDGGGNGEMTLREFRSILETSYHGKFD